MPRLSAVGISGLQAGEDVKHRVFSGKQLPSPEALTQLAIAERVNLIWLLTQTTYTVGVPTRRPASTPLTSVTASPTA